MNYQRPLQRSAGPKKFPVGTHQAKITKVQKKNLEKTMICSRFIWKGPMENEGFFI